MLKKRLVENLKNKNTDCEVTHTHTHTSPLDAIKKSKDDMDLFRDRLNRNEYYKLRTEEAKYIVESPNRLRQNKESQPEDRILEISQKKRKLEQPKTAFYN